MKQTDIKDLTPLQLAEWLRVRKYPAYTAGQIQHWIYPAQTDDFDRMTNLKKALRQELSEAFVVERLKTQEVVQSTDGSRKFLFRLRDGALCESVLIPERDYHTLCVSSQVGCAQACRFCMTAQGGLVRNLTKGEIEAQIRDVALTVDESKPLSNVVFMGMGEPLANYDNVLAALRTILDNGHGLGFSWRRVTLSTAGLVPQIDDLGRQLKVGLAVSLNATDNQTRSRLMPINRRYPIEDLMAACRRFPLPPRRYVTIEYVLLKGINDSVQQARELVGLLHGFAAKVNLIPFNGHPGCGFEAPDPQDVLRFQKVLLARRFAVMVRHSKGADIGAACGQLRANHIRL